nr:translocon-associated protein subunit delta-like [Parasteatoda tepidariorum]
MVLLILHLFYLQILHNALAEICENPTIDTKTYITNDGIIASEVVVVNEIAISCTPFVHELALYVEKSGKLIAAVKSSDNSKYQLSWTERGEQIFSGEHYIKVYDEKGYAALRKAHLYNKDTSNIPPAFLLSFYYSGIYNESMISSKSIVVVISMILCYLAFTQKANIRS